MITQYACRKNDGKTTFTSGEVSFEKVISIAGGDLTLNGVASVQFPQGTFSQDVAVKLSKTKSQEIREDMRLTSILYDIIEDVKYEIRINTKLSPNKNVTVNLEVPDSIVSRVPSNYGLSVYAKLDFSDSTETLTRFALLQTKFDGSKNRLQVELNPMYFTREGTSDQSFEATLTIGTSLGENSSLGVVGDCCDKFACPTSDCSLISRGYTRDIKVNPADNSKKTPHRAIDIAGELNGPVFAVADGKVIASASGHTELGNYIVIQHQSATCRYRTLYGHLNKREVTTGAEVKKGQIIGLIGSTGRSTGPHLHFEYYFGEGAPLTKTDIFDALKCMPSGQVLVDIPICASGCFGAVGLGQKFIIKIHSITRQEFVLVDTSVTVREYVIGYIPTCDNPPPEDVVLKLPFGNYLIRFYHNNKEFYNGFPGNPFGFTIFRPPQGPCTLVVK